MEGSSITSIAWDGEYLAADSRVTAGTMIVTDEGTKLYRINDVPYKNDLIIAMGVSGALSDVEKIINFIKTGFEPKDEFNHYVGAILVGLDYVYALEPDSSHLIQYKRSIKLTEGSGGPFALSAMRLGLSAKDAVKHAIKMDTASGGKVKALDCRLVKEEK